MAGTTVRSTERQQETRPGKAVQAPVVGLLDMALDTVAEVVRTLGRYPLEQPNVDSATFTSICEQWSQHILLATAPPGANKDPAAGGASEARRDWMGVRNFVRDYCRGSVTHARTVMTDLRQVVWVFIQNLQQTYVREHEADTRVREHIVRLEALARSNATEELKRETLATVVSLSQIMEERRSRQDATMQALGDEVRKLGLELEVARRESETDPLTQLYNRKAFDEYLERTLLLCRGFGQPACLMIVDLDNFKDINDRWGHTTGDDVLRRLADTVTRVFLRKGDFVARYGGDEIAVVLRETTIEVGIGLAERLLKAMRQVEMEKDEERISLRASVGLATPHGEDNTTAWIDRADKALYQAKQDGRDRLAVADAPPPR